MANFATEFPLDGGSSVSDVVNLARTWITGSPHTKIRDEDLGDLPIDESVVFSVGAEAVTIAMATQAEFQIGGLRYVKTEGSLEWTTCIVARKSASELLLSLQVVCEGLSTAVRLPPPKKPYFIGQVLKKLGGGTDGEIPVADRPFKLEEGEHGIAAALMLGTAQNRLPIVYVSADDQGRHCVDPNELAKLVSGMAHVVVEPSRYFSFKLRRLADSRNAFDGAVGVYWPESSARRLYLSDETGRNSRALQLEIASDIRAALANRRLRSNCTWLHLNETVAKVRFDALRARGSTDVDEYIAAFDADLSAKDARLTEADGEIARLSAEIRRLSAGAHAREYGLLKPGKEQDFYPGEISDVILDALREGLRGAAPSSRREHILADLMEHNPGTGAGVKLAEEIKSTLRGYRDMSSPVRSALHRLGFEITDDGKHHKAVFHHDGRYTFSIPKTSSDVRAGLNLASDINKQLF